MLSVRSLKQTGLPVKGELGLVDTPQSPGGSGLTVQHWKLFAPRLGLAYRLTDKTVIRTGYGMFFLPSDLYFSSAPWSSPVNMITTPWVSTLNGGYTPCRDVEQSFSQWTPSAARAKSELSKHFVWHRRVIAAGRSAIPLRAAMELQCRAPNHRYTYG